MWSKGSTSLNSLGEAAVADAGFCLVIWSRVTNARKCPAAEKNYQGSHQCWQTSLKSLCNSIDLCLQVPGCLGRMVKDGFGRESAKLRDLELSLAICFSGHWTCREKFFSRRSTEGRKWKWTGSSLWHWLILDQGMFGPKRDIWFPCSFQLAEMSDRGMP